MISLDSSRDDDALTIRQEELLFVAQRYALYLIPVKIGVEATLDRTYHEANHS
jgi:hypothetical protein